MDSLSKLIQGTAVVTARSGPAAGSLLCVPPLAHPFDVVHCMRIGYLNLEKKEQKALIYKTHDQCFCAAQGWQRAPVLPYPDGVCSERPWAASEVG